MGGKNQSGCFKVVSCELKTENLLKMEEVSGYTLNNRDNSNWIFVTNTIFPINLGQIELKFHKVSKFIKRVMLLIVYLGLYSFNTPVLDGLLIICKSEN